MLDEIDCDVVYEVDDDDYEFGDCVVFDEFGGVVYCVVEVGFGGDFCVLFVGFCIGDEFGVEVGVDCYLFFWYGVEGELGVYFGDVFCIFCYDYELDYDED